METLSDSIALKGEKRCCRVSINEDRESIFGRKAIDCPHSTYNRRCKPPSNFPVDNEKNYQCWIDNGFFFPIMTKGHDDPGEARDIPCQSHKRGKKNFRRGLQMSAEFCIFAFRM